MRKKAKPEHFIHKPKYPGGKKAMDEFIRGNMRYPEEAIQNKIEGMVALKFDTDEYGLVSNVQVIHGIGHGCNEEAVRLVKLLRFEKTKKPGLRVTFHQSLNIHFRLPSGSLPVKENKRLHIGYQYKENTPVKPVKNYTYSIKTGG